MDAPRTILNQIGRFLLVSGVSLAIDYGVYLSLTDFTSLDSSQAKRASFACIFLWGFFAHKRFTFKNRGFHPSQPLRFALLYLSGWLINSTVHDYAALEPETSNPAFLAATFVWACWNFLGQRYFVFRQARSPEKAS